MNWRQKMRHIKWIVLGLASLAMLAGAALYLYAKHEMRFAPATVTYDLKYGSNLRSVARELAAQGVMSQPLWFEVLGRVRGDAPHIKAGNYEFTSPMSPVVLLRKITRGDATQAAIRFVEGWTFRQVRNALDAHEALTHDTRGLSDEAIALKLGIADGRIEGWIFPESYFFARGSSDLAVLQRAHKLMRTHLTARWESRATGLPLASPYEALTLASIIEKETGKAADRPLVSSVFVNRLRQGMRLQTDPTVIYGMGEGFNGNLRRRDLQADTPWNTYTRAGLPPTPIAMPGLASLHAAVSPAASPLLYFVARGDGSSQFSQSLDEHNAAVTKYQRAHNRGAAK
jgi:UPF0755 protein